MEYESSSSKSVNDKFMAALDLNKLTIGDVSVAKQSDRTISTMSYGSTVDDSLEPIYLSFPNELSNETYHTFQQTSSIQELSDIIYYSDATIQYEPTTLNSDYRIDVPVQDIVNSLNPLVLESKQYLYAKGFTERDIQEMIAEEGGTEQDLIPFVMLLAENEKNDLIVKNNSGIFMNTVYARYNLTADDYSNCAMAAIGADVLWALGGSSASAWTMAAMRSAFGAVAKRMLGPVGVAIAVVSFGLCLHAAG
ncbi:hypothetical protein ACSX1A_18350 [Pontibacter sp. MBLB2868]|uniref:hypothetical protein n=1 Tax=Pontibacter sp. MBLB2868 TaxID=3451555 RepID=UPI003F74F8A1